MRAACFITVAAALLAACAPMMPLGPTVAAMPAPNKPFEVFIQDDQSCRNWAGVSIGPGRDAANDQMLASTVTGAVIGAAAGALVGNHHDAGGGAAFGTLAGASVGTSQSSMSSWSMQRRYDIAYQQCMYAKGNVIPGYNPYPVSPPPRY